MTHDEFVSVKIALIEYYMKEEIKNPEKAVAYTLRLVSA